MIIKKEFIATILFVCLEAAASLFGGHGRVRRLIMLFGGSRQAWANI
jgi:hypothetical protein